MKKVCLLAFVLFTWSIVVNAQESDGRYVEVTGSSEIEVVPDEIHFLVQIKEYWQEEYTCLLYTSDAADDQLCVDFGGCRSIQKKKKSLIERSCLRRHKPTT